MPPSHRPSRPAAAAVAVCLVFFGVLYFELSLPGDPLAHGDTHTDERAVIGAQQFNATGIGALKFVQTEEGGAEIGLRPSWYERHPAGGVAILALLERLGLTAAQSRFAPLLASTMSVWFLFLFVRRATGRAWVAALAAAAYASLAPVWLLADSFQLYSYALMVKTAVFWLVAEGLAREGRARRVCWASAGLACLACVALLGLETMPAAGLFAFFHPLIAGTGRFRSRLVTALHAAAWIGGGMALGGAIRIGNMSLLRDGGIGRALSTLLVSIRSRTIAESHETTLTRPYVLEIAHRLWVFAPQLYLAVGLVAILAAMHRLVMKTWPVATGMRFVWSCLLAEGLYFVAMHNHVTVHIHTTVHLGVAVAAIITGAGVIFGDVLGWTGATVGRIAGLATLFAATAWLTPLHSEGNLVLPHGAETSGYLPFAREIDALVADIPARSIVVTTVDGPAAFTVASRLALRQITCVRIDPALVDRNPRTVVDRARASGRPSFALTMRRADDRAAASVVSHARLANVTERLALFAIGDTDVARRAPLNSKLAEAVLKQTKFSEPSAEALARAHVTGPMFGGTARGVWMNVPGPDLARAAVGQVPFVIEPGFSPITSAAAEFIYDLRPTVKQPKILVGLRLRTAAPSAAPIEQELEALPGATVTCRVAVPDGVQVVGFDIWARRPDGTTATDGAAVNCAAITFEHR